jgi:4-amino-4-deoxy-L-arabinose transferase-like glycosyltransferase
MAQREDILQADVHVQTDRAARRWRARALLFGAAAVLLGLAWWLRAPLHALPLERDEGAYALIGARWMAGDIPYRDLFDHKPPLVYLVFGLARLVPGEPVRAVRVLATLYLFGGSLVLLALGRLLYGRRAALVALALALAYGSSLRFQGVTFNTEAVLVLPALLGCLAAVAAVQARWPALLGLAGVCVGLAIAAKPVGAALLVPLAMAPFLMSAPPRERAAMLIAGLLGAAAAPVAFALLLWQKGALPAAYEALVVYNRIYAAESVALGWDPTWLWRSWRPMLVLALPALAGLLAIRATREWDTAGHRLALLWGVALLATALLSLRAYPHYYLAAVPLLSLWAGVGGVAAARWAGRRIGPLVPSAAAFLALVVLLAVPAIELQPLRSQTPYEQIGTLYGPEGYAFFGHADEVAAYVAKRAPPEQPIFVWAAEPEIYLLANRRSASRFIYDYPLDRLPGAREQLLDALRRERPMLMITYHDVRPIDFPPLPPARGYRLAATIGGFDVYEPFDG